VVPLAAALSIPQRTAAGTPFPHRSLLLVVATGVVVITLVVQGTTLAPLVRRLGVVTASTDSADELRRARHALALAALQQLDAVAESEEAPRQLVERVRQELRHDAESTRGHEPEHAAGSSSSGVALRGHLLDIQAEELARLRLAGEISADTFRQVQHQLDIEHARLDG
jgi:CPA1 family monovalent cation:H+ antiporter